MKKNAFIGMKSGVCLSGLIILNTLFTSSHASVPGEKTTHFYIGTYTMKGSEGIYRAALDTESGKLSDLKLVAKSDDPSYIAFSPDGNYLLAVNETADEKVKKAGHIESFSLSPARDQLARISKVTSGGAHPCYVSVNEEGFVLAANYTGGSVGLIRMEKNGMLQPADVKQHYGKGPNGKRQEGPHVHSAYFEPGTDRIFVADLGIDVVAVYQIDKNKTQLVAAKVPRIKLPAGSGPRHLAFHPSRNILYVADELSSSVSVVSLNEDGSFTLLETVSALPADYSKPNTCADIHVTKDGRFLYISNRGLNSLAIFEINQKDGRLKLIAQESTRGETPRNFTLSPDEDFLLVANQTTHNIVSFRRDKNSGKLTYADQMKAFVPVCLLFDK